MTEPLLTIAGLSRTFSGRGRVTAALADVGLTIGRGETVAVVGASGSGKTTLARCILRLIQPDAGSIRFKGVDLLTLGGAPLKALRPRLQMVFQDPMAAFNPRATVARLLDDPLRLHAIVPAHERRDEALRLLARVHLPADLIDRYPHEMSGGQRQRVAIARAIATRPDLIVLDEPVSALDVSVRAQIINLLLDIQQDTGLAYLLISHDLPMVRAVCDRVAVMDAGRIVESGTPAQVFAAPQAEAARRLVAAAGGVGAGDVETLLSAG